MRGAELVPESEEYGISSFVYRNRKPFAPQKLHDLMIANFFLQKRAEEAADEDENEEKEETRRCACTSAHLHADAHAHVHEDVHACQHA